MEKKVIGTVVSVKKQWWLKINTKPMRSHALDGAIFPHIIKVSYTVDGTEYFKRRWVAAGSFVPPVGSSATVAYSENNPAKAKVLL